MEPLTLVFTILQLLSSLFLIAVVVFQSGKRSGLSGSIAGVADTFLAKNKAKSMDAILAKATKWVAVVFVAITLALGVLI